jgi:hypothetical protein
MQDILTSPILASSLCNTPDPQLFRHKTDKEADDCIALQQAEAAIRR